VYNTRGELHNRSMFSAAREESRMARDEFRIAGGEPHMARGERRMTSDCCLPEKSIHRSVHTHSQLNSNISGLVVLFENIE